jgi:hypothetical protein
MTPEDAIVTTSGGRPAGSSYHFTVDHTNGRIGIVNGPTVSTIPSRDYGIDLHSDSTNAPDGQIRMTRSRNAAAAGAGIFRRKSRGVLGTELQLNSGDGLGSDAWQGWNGLLGYATASVTAGATTTEAYDTVGGTGLGARYTVATNATGGTVLVNTMTALGGDVGVGPSALAPAARLDAIEETLGDAVQKLESVATNDNPVSITYQNRVETTNNTVTTLHNMTLTASTTYRIEAHVTARRTAGAAGAAEDSAGYIIIATYKSVGGTATLVGAVSALYTAEDQAGWNATLAAAVAGGCSANTDICVRVTGATNNTITWHLDRLVVSKVST